MSWNERVLLMKSYRTKIIAANIPIVLSLGGNQANSGRAASIMSFVTNEFFLFIIEWTSLMKICFNIWNWWHIGKKNDWSFKIDDVCKKCNFVETLCIQVNKQMTLLRKLSIPLWIFSRLQQKCVIENFIFYAMWCIHVSKFICSDCSYDNIRVANREYPQYKKNYPYKYSEATKRRRKCSVCNLHLAKWVKLWYWISFGIVARFQS